MTDENENPTAKSVGNGNLRPFAKGFDKRRWMQGRGKKSPAQKEGEEILLAVIWEELSREFDTVNLKPLEQPETVDALRLGVRNTIKKNFDKIMERIAGKVKEVHDHNVNATLTWREFINGSGNTEPDSK